MTLSTWWSCSGTIWKPLDGPDQTSLPNQPRRNRREVPNLLSWVQCFGTYMAVVASKHPERVKQLLAQASRGKTCTLCMESDHVEEVCALAPPKAGSSGVVGARSILRQEGGDSGSRLARGKAKMVCFAWNQGDCNFPYCRYRYVCVKCAGNHRITQCRAVT